VVADLLINKPLGISTPHIEFRRSKLYDVNPVGTFLIIFASMAVLCAYSGLFGKLAHVMA
jgi:hypothetical protein